MMGLEKYVSVQPQYSLLARGIEYELVPVCKDNNIAIIPWSPLKGGWLSGRYKRGEEIPPDCRIGWADKVGWSQTNSKWKNDTTYDLLDKIKVIADSLNATMVMVSVRWVMQKDFITSTIIGARSVEQLNDNLNAINITLSPEHMKVLDDATAMPLFYPYDLQATSQRKRTK